MIFYEQTLAGFIDPYEGVYSEAVHSGKIFYDAPVAVEPHELMQAFRRQGKKVPDMSVIFDIGAGIGFLGMDEIREFERIADKKDREAQADYVIVSFGGVKFDGKASRVTISIRRAFGADDCREADEKACGYVWIAQKCGAGVFGHTPVGAEGTEGTASFGVDDAFRDAFPIEMCHFFDKLHVL